MAVVRLWNSEAWLRRQYITLKIKPADIAKNAGCSQITIYRKLREFGLMK